MADPKTKSLILAGNLFHLCTYKKQHGNRLIPLQFTAPSPAEAEDWVDQIQFLMKGESGSLA